MSVSPRFVTAPVTGWKVSNLVSCSFNLVFLSMPELRSHPASSFSSAPTAAGLSCGEDHSQQVFKAPFLMIFDRSCTWLDSILEWPLCCMDYTCSKERQNHLTLLSQCTVNLKKQTALSSPMGQLVKNTVHFPLLDDAAWNKRRNKENLEMTKLTQLTAGAVESWCKWQMMQVTQLTHFTQLMHVLSFSFGLKVSFVANFSGDCCHPP